VHPCEILKRKGRRLLSYKAAHPEAESAQGIRIGIDIGGIHPEAACTEKGVCFVVSSRDVRSVKDAEQFLPWF
jgi:hypothetical protein